MAQLIELPSGYYVDEKTCIAYDQKGQKAGPAVRSHDKWFVFM